jgi:hypothetical protein
MEPADQQVKHLEMIQSAISRMAGNSFLLKGWNVTLATATIALTAKDNQPQLATLVIIPIVIFWGLDSYYLGLEKRFRDLHKTVANNPDPQFGMQPDAVDAALWWECMWRPAVWLVHLVPLLLAGAIAVYGFCGLCCVMPAK